MKVLNRAKALDGTGGYITSQSIKFENEKMFLYSIPFRQWVECDESTRSINFEDMIDVKGNKIFASLGEDGKGGDVLFDMEYEYTLSFDGLKFNLQGLFSQSSFNEFDNWENFDIIGIQQ